MIISSGVSKKSKDRHAAGWTIFPNNHQAGQSQPYFSRHSPRESSQWWLQADDIRSTANNIEYTWKVSQLSHCSVHWQLAHILTIPSQTSIKYTHFLTKAGKACWRQFEAHALKTQDTCQTTDLTILGHHFGWCCPT